MARLNVEQLEVLRVVDQGHNVFLTGQGGTGKSYLIGEIYRSLKKRGQNVAIICSSGIATTVHDDLSTVRTVHSCYGLQTADSPSDVVIQRSLSNNLVRERVSSAACIIWDEASMSSRRIFEIVNRIHHLLVPQNDHFKPFGGKQVIVVGEFLQLRPVPSNFDEGQPMYESGLFHKCLPHRYKLLTNMRQNTAEREFLRLLNEISLGKCSEESEMVIRSLERKLPSNLDRDAVHIFFKKLPAQLHNLSVLHSMPGDVLRFDAIDEGNTSGIKCPAEQSVFLKPGCKIMLLWNKSDKLRNGSSGTFLTCDGERIVVKFPEVGTVQLNRETWQNRDLNGNVVGLRRQFPVGLMFAITCHKSQGLTLPAVVLHCSKEFVSGLIYVALTRVRSCETIQVLDFRPSQLTAPSTDAINICSCHAPPNQDDCICCRDKSLTEEDFLVADPEYFNHQMETLQSNEVGDATERVINSYFERGDPDDSAIDLETVYLFLTDDEQNDFVKNPPQDFDVVPLLKNLQVGEPLSELANEKNRELQSLVNSNTQTRLLGQVLWCRGCQIVLEGVVCDLEAIEISRKQWSENTRNLYLLITRSPSFLRDFNYFFKSEQLTQAQRVIGAELMVEVYKAIIHHIANRINKREENTPIEFHVKEMPSEGLAKLRHVGAWAIRKVLNSELRYVKSNIASPFHQTQQHVYKSYARSHLIEEYIVANFSDLELNSKYPETLTVTEERQYRTRGLTHIEDVAYEFFLEAESLRVLYLNETKMKQFKGDVVDSALAALKNDDNLRRKWEICFPGNVIAENREHIKHLFTMVITKYVMVGAGQFLRDYRLAHRLKKSAEHRKLVLQRKQRIEEKRAEIQFDDIVADRSEGKKESHVRIKVYVDKFGVSALVKAYSKNQLTKLSQAYGVACNCRSNKTTMGCNLLPVIKACECMPHPYFVDNLQAYAEVDDDTHRVILRITRHSPSSN